MKKLTFLLLIAMIASACGINKQIERARAFEKCRYDILSADSIYLAGIDVKQVVKSQNFDLLKSPRLALYLLRKDIPFEGRLNLQIKNPSNTLAAINQFEYKILIKDQELASGLIDKAIAVQPNGGVLTVPIRINSNIYNLLTDSKAQREVSDFFNSLTGGSGQTRSIVTIKIKPTIGVGNKLIKYPGYITIDKEISKKIFM